MAVPQRWRFGVFEVDAAKAELRRNGLTLKVREQPFRILVYLLEHAGELVTREDLRRVLWPSDTYVDFEHSLNTAIMKLRDVLGDSADAPIYIETVPRRGYRFVAPVAQAGQAVPFADTNAGSIEFSQTETAQPQISEPSPVEIAEPSPEIDNQVLPLDPSPVSLAVHRASVPRGVLIAGVLVFFAFAGSVAYFLIQRSGVFKSDGASQRELLRTVPITSAAGDSISPEFSPDGREIAFVWDGEDRKGYDVYVQLIGASLPLRLTYHQRGLVGPPAWSPDSREIAFERCDGKRDGIFAVPALGGEERQITTAACHYTLPNPVVWVANGNEMLMMDRCAPNGGFGVVVFALATGQKRCLTNSASDKHDEFGRGFALSPDGSTIAFGKTTGSLCCDVYKVGVDGGPIDRLTSDGETGCTTLSDFGCAGVMWTPDSRSVVYVNNRDALPALFRVAVNGGASTREVTYPAIGSSTRDGTRFAYSQHSSSDPAAVWRANLLTPGGALREKNKIIASQFPEADAQPSADGRRIAWMSLRTGSEELFVSDSAGHNQMQLTHLNRYSGSPRWSPDNNWVAFDSYVPSGRAQIFITEANGRNLHSLISAPFDCAVPSWSHDGKSIYYSANQGGVWQVWKRNLDTGADVQLTKQGGFDPFESTDGKTVYYTRFYEAGIWKVSSAGGNEIQVIPDRPQIGFWGHYSVAATGLYFLDNDANPHPTIEFYNFETGRINAILTMDEHPARLQPSLSTTADGKTIYFTQYDRQSVIKMMEFRP